MLFVGMKGRLLNGSIVDWTWFSPVVSCPSDILLIWDGVPTSSVYHIEFPSRFASLPGCNSPIIILSVCLYTGHLTFSVEKVLFLKVYFHIDVVRDLSAVCNTEKFSIHGFLEKISARYLLKNYLLANFQKFPFLNGQ